MLSAAVMQGSCGLYYSGQQQLFASCVDLNATLGTDYNLLWSVLDSGTGSGSILSAAIDAQQPGGWAAFGFPAAPNSGMIGGSAMIVKADPKSPTGGQQPPRAKAEIVGMTTNLHSSFRGRDVPTPMGTFRQSK